MADRPFYPLQEMALSLGLRINPKGEPLRTTVDKVRKRLLYAVEHDELHLIGPPPLGLFHVQQVMAWARRKWPEAFSEVQVHHEAEGQSHLGLKDSLTADVIPGELERCQDVLQTAYTTIHTLERELAVAHKELARLRPLAERYEQNREKNRRSAKRPRKEPH